MIVNLFELKELFALKVAFTEGDASRIPNRFGKTQAIFFESLPCNGKGTTCFAYLGMPNAPMPQGGYPAMVLVHGAGGCAVHEWVEYWNGKGYAAIAIDLYGQQYGCVALADASAGKPNPNGRVYKDENGGWIFNDNGSFEYTEHNYKQSWTYYNVANIILAHNILLAHELVNKNRIGLTGISMGGVLTGIVSGIDERFSAFAPVFATGFQRKYRGVGWNQPLNTDLGTWKKIFDPQSYVAFNEKPMLFTMGMDDCAFSPANAQPTYDRSKGQMTYSYRKNLRHYLRFLDENNMIHVSKFMDQALRGIKMPFQVTEERIENGCFQIKIDGAKQVNRICFVYSDRAEGDDWLQWKWESVELPVADVVRMEIPKTAKYCFFELSDQAELEFSVSSSLHCQEIE